MSCCQGLSGLWALGVSWAWMQLTKCPRSLSWLECFGHTQLSWLRTLIFQLSSLSPFPSIITSMFFTAVCGCWNNVRANVLLFFLFFFFPGKALSGLLLLQERPRPSIRLPYTCFLPEGEQGVSYELTVRLRPRVGWEDWFRSFAHRLVPLCAGGVRSTLLLLPTACFCSRCCRSGSRIFQSLCIFCPDSQFSHF